MAEQVLHGAQIAGRLQYMGGKRVAQHVWMQMGGQSGFLRPARQPQLDLPDAQALPLAGDKDGPGGCGGSGCQPALNGGDGFTADGNDTGFAALAGDDGITGSQIQHGQIQPG